MSRLATEFEFSQPLLGSPMEVAGQFRAFSFRASELSESMDPLLMFDHFWMRRDPFGWHPHKSISAFTYVFEDSKSAHLNTDSMGDNSAITPGSFHWMVAGSGAMHRERPDGDDPLVHGLQVFVELPDPRKLISPYSIHLDTKRVPEVTQPGARIRVVAGKFGDAESPAELPQPFSLYDVFLHSEAPLSIPLPARSGAWLYTVQGEASIAINGERRVLPPNRAVAVATLSNGQVATIQSEDCAQIVVLAGAKLGRVGS